MRFLSVFRPPRLMGQKPGLRLGVKSKIGVVQWAPRKGKKR